jgi:hypothetical protein
MALLLAERRELGQPALHDQPVPDVRSQLEKQISTATMRSGVRNWRVLS